MAASCRGDPGDRDKAIVTLPAQGEAECSGRQMIICGGKGDAPEGFILGLPLLPVSACCRFPSAGADRPDRRALTGQVTSAEEGPMEGVLVSAKRAGSTITITVVSDEQGRYSSPPRSSSRPILAAHPCRRLRSRPPGDGRRRRGSTHRRSEAAQDRRPRLAALERRMDRERSGLRPAEELATRTASAATRSSGS